MWTNYLVKSGFGYLTDSINAAYTRKWEEYQNKMINIQAAQAQNSITQNEVTNRRAHAQNKVDIQITNLMAASKVKAGAAAAGVAGGSVDATLFDVGRNAGRQLAKESDRFEQSLLVTNQQRRNVELQRSMAVKPLTPKPTVFGALANAGVDILGEMETKPGSSGTLLDGATQMEDNSLASTWDKLKTTMLG